MFSIYGFIEYTKKNPDDFKFYCEIIMGLHGEIYQAIPCHQYALLALASNLHKISKEEYKSSIPMNCSPTHWIVSKEKLIPIWYNRLIIPYNGLNRFQSKSIELLQSANLITNDLYIEETNEYQLHLWRKKTFGVD